MRRIAGLLTLAWLGLSVPLAAQDTLGRIQLARGRCVEAERTFREALEAEALAEGTRAKLQDGAARASACPRH